MGAPRFGWDEIPLAYPLDTAAMPVGWEGLREPFAVNVGNPHIVFFVEDAETVDLERLGPLIEHDPLFPERINVNVASFEGDAIRLRVWERGAGMTRACGTGACATAVAAVRRSVGVNGKGVADQNHPQVRWVRRRHPGESRDLGETREPIVLSPGFRVPIKVLR